MSRRPIIAVVGDATLEAGCEKERLAEGLGERLVGQGYRVLTGGLGGVMDAACRGARRAKEYVPGDTIGILPGTDPDEANDQTDIVLPTGLDHARNIIVANADAVVAIGGGAGTLTEMAFAWIYKRLVIGFKVSGWSGKLAGTRIDERNRYPGLTDDQVFGVATVDEAIAVLEERLATYVGRHRAIRRR